MQYMKYPPSDELIEIARANERNENIGRRERYNQESHIIFLRGHCIRTEQTIELQTAILKRIADVISQPRDRVSPAGNLQDSFVWRQVPKHTRACVESQNRGVPCDCK